MSGLQHPNIAQVVDFNVSENGTPYLVMELLDGRDLEEVLRGTAPLPLARVAAIVRQIASALDAAHARGVIHRDLKPENVILLSVGGNEAFVKVIDFGISKVMWTSKRRLTRESTVLGTPQYMAPEQAQGRIEAIDHRTDQFALAAMTYGLISGREPFTGDTPLAILYQVVNADPVPLTELVDWPAERVDTVVRRALSKQPEGRYDGVLEFSRAFDEAVAAALTESGRIPISGSHTAIAPGDTGELIAISESAPHPARRSRRRWPVAAVVTTLLLAGALAVAYGAVPDPQRSWARGRLAAAYGSSSAVIVRGWDAVRGWFGR
jgi:serine/threonine protein kinase